MNRDKYGIISQIQSDGSFEGGDSVNWMGHYIYLTKDETTPLSIFEAGKGGYVRHPYPEMTNNGFGAYYKNPWNGCISRDQLTGILGALIKVEDHASFRRVFLHHLARLCLFAYNTIKNGSDPSTAKWKFPDLTLFDIWAMYIRGFNLWYLYPVLCVLDLHLLINAFLINKKSDTDVISFAMKFMVSQDYLPTFVSKLAKRVLNIPGLLTKLCVYWTGWRDHQGMFELYKKKLEEV